MDNQKTIPKTSCFSVKTKELRLSVGTIRINREDKCRFKHSQKLYEDIASN
jgi:hypothetical protein